MYITRLPVRRSRPPTRRSNQSHALSSTTTALKTEKASSESIRPRASTTVEYENRLEKPEGVERKDAARRLTRAREPGHLMRLSRSHLTRSHGKRDRKPAPVPSFFLQPSPPNNPERVRAQEAGMECLIRTPSRHPRSALWIPGRYKASDPRPDMLPSWGRVGRRLTTL